MSQVKNPKWDKCRTEGAGEIQDVSKGQEIIPFGHLEIGMSVDSLYKGICVFTKIESILEKQGIRGNITRIDTEDGETIGDLSLGNKVFVPFEYICHTDKDIKP